LAVILILEHLNSSFFKRLNHDAMCKFLAILSACFHTNSVGDPEFFFKQGQCSVMGIEAARRC
jgi:hypothetical protein